MEDSHIADLDLGNGISFFGVYDGHGGKNHYIFENPYLDYPNSLFFRKWNGRFCERASCLRT